MTKLILNSEFHMSFQNTGYVKLILVLEETTRTTQYSKYHQKQGNKNGETFNSIKPKSARMLTHELRILFTIDFLFSNCFFAKSTFSRTGTD